MYVSTYIKLRLFISPIYLLIFTCIDNSQYKHMQYSLEQRIFNVKTSWIKNTMAATQRAFPNEFRVPRYFKQGNNFIDHT